MQTEQGQYHDWRDSSSGGVATREGFASRFALGYRGNPKHGKAESRRWQSCIDQRGLGIQRLT
jgi:hypothetical protein